MRLITLAGCSFYIFNACVTAPVATEFLNRMGFTELEFGMISGIPMIMLCLQFGSALLNTHVVTRRKPWFVLFISLSRLVLIPLALTPVLFPFGSRESHIQFIIMLTCISSATGNLTTPLWYSWLADLIPHPILNRFWSRRERVLQITSISAAMAVAVATYCAQRFGLDVIPFFILLTCVGCVAGITDMLLYLRIHEPPHVAPDKQSIVASIFQPLIHREYRSFILFSCAFSAVTSFAAAFMLLYTLKELKISLWQTSLMWMCPAIGVVMAVTAWGRLADRHGQKPILEICSWFKPGIALIFLLVTPGTALWVMPLALLLDGMLNSGIMIASNGYMLKMAPQNNRAMFIAFITGLAGICGGLAAMAGGVFLNQTAGVRLTAFDRTWNHYHLLFLISFLLRFIPVYLARRIREPEVSDQTMIVNDLVKMWPLRALRYPVGLYRRITGSSDTQPW